MQLHTLKQNLGLQIFTSVYGARSWERVVMEGTKIEL